MRRFVGEAADGVEQLLSSDVWVLYATLLVAGDGRAELSNVIAAADMVNHAIVTWDELNGALMRLQGRGMREREQPQGAQGTREAR